MDPKTIFTICFVAFVVLSFVVAGFIYKRQERRERERENLLKRIKDSGPHIFC